jgi:hypothetical protein
MCNILYAEGYAILKVDATNGFQEIKRSSLHRAVANRCSSLLSLFTKYYTKESMCFFNMENGVKLLSATEGARIGCKLSSFAFALTVQDLYESIKRSFLRARDGSCIKAVTDDVIIVLEADPSNQEALYAKVNDICADLKTGGAKVGLSFSNDKALLLLPKDWAPKPYPLLPDVALRSNMFENKSFKGSRLWAHQWGLKVSVMLLFAKLWTKC